MYSPLALYIGLRYMRGQSSDRFGRFVSWLSTIGITLGVMALIIVLSVMNGFEREMSQGILQYMPQAIVTSPQGSINPQQIPASEIKKQLNHIQSIASLTTGEVVVQSHHSLAVTTMLGIQPDDSEPLANNILYGELSDLKAGQYGAIIGRGLAYRLGVRIGDQIRLMVTSVSQLTPIGRVPSQRLFTITGLFSVNSEIDPMLILVNQEDAGKLMRYPPGNITGWRIFLHNPLQIDNLVNQSLPAGLIFKDWREKKGDLFHAVKMEKNMMVLLISLIIAVAAFNMITSLSLLVMEKQGEIAILQTQGLTRMKVMAIFIVQGASAGIIGSLFGTISGVLIALHLSEILNFIGLSIDGIPLPSLVIYSQVMVISLFAVSLALLSTLYPSWRAATIEPAEALRYE